MGIGMDVDETGITTEGVKLSMFDISDPADVEEVQKYKTEQKRRLSVTPGMTGLWQTSGRSEIYDFNEIVKLDLEYIDKWSIGLDIKLLVKTIVVCVRGDGAK